MDDIEYKDTRSGFGVGLLELGHQDEEVVALCADLTSSVKMDAFKSHYPNRFFQCGVAEANMIGVAAGLATGGKKPYVSTFANFATGRVYDQIRQSVCYSDKNVKICASHSGLTLGEDGATHQILEDIGLMKMLPNMRVVVPCDYNQTRLATLASIHIESPMYIRFGRPKMPNFTPIEDPSFEIGKAQILRAGKDITIFSCGHLVWESMKAADELKDRDGLYAEVINVHTIKPLDSTTIIDSLKRTKIGIVAEEHQKNGGLGDSIAQLCCMRYPCNLDFIAVNDQFGESGTPMELLNKYKLDRSAIYKAAIELYTKNK